MRTVTLKWAGFAIGVIVLWQLPSFAQPKPTSGGDIAIPVIQNTKWPRNPIDFFVMRKMEEKGLFPASEADPYTLAQRAFMDLTGLPPTIKELKEFVNDRNPQAYEKLIDRLLKSKAHQEYWALALYHEKRPASFENPEKAKAWVMRLWKQVFGKGLTETAHPNLLKWLAQTAQGRDDAKLIRLMVTSATYRQSSQNPEADKIDPNNVLLAHYPLENLPFWLLYRKILFVSGRWPEGKEEVPVPFRKPLPPDGPKGPTHPEVVGPFKISTNSPWIQKCFKASAQLILKEGGKTDEERVRFAYLLWLQKPPTDQELTLAVKALGNLRKQNGTESDHWTDFSWALLHSKEFLFKR